jgi:uncharacterized membrane protein YhaH (DUF805 family)
MAAETANGAPKGDHAMRFPALLASATLFGGMMIYSFGLAPLVFKTLSVDEAGRMLRQAFSWYYLFIVGCAVIAAALLLAADASSALVMAAIAIVAIYARQGLMPRINSARDQQVRGDAAASKRFARLHGLSVILNFIQLFGAGLVLFRFS